MASIRDVLDNSPVARAAASLDLGAGRAVTIWENHADRLRYDTARGHVFSLYLDGGNGTRRVDRGGQQGFAGAICVMPDGHSSEWEITAAFRFVHLYLPDHALRAGFARIHDCDARLMDLPEVTLADMPDLAAPMARLATAAGQGDLLGGETAVAELLARLGPRQIALRGGLAPYVLRRIDAWIDAHLDQAIHLADLAVIADLSPFHLHRMFRVSRGTTLQDWITERRIDRAKELLRGSMSLIQIAMTCGFASQSHMTRVFKTRVMLTPAAYRATVMKGRMAKRFTG